MSDRVVAIHQPNYLPWIGYFHKIYHSDVFVYLDDVEYTSGSWINRNKVKIPNGWMWLTVPTVSSSDKIRDTRIATHEDWRREHRRTLQQNYGGAEYFDQFESFLDTVYACKWQHIVDLNVFLIEEICRRLEIDTEFVYASDLDGGEGGADHLARLADSVDADVYFSGTGSKGYMHDDPFDEVGVDVRYQRFESPEYSQRFDGFEPDLSVIDMLLNLGTANTREILTEL